LVPSISPKALVLAAVPIALWAYKDGPPPKMTGGFGDATCHMCHADNPPNAPGGELALRGIPERYSPGQAYSIEIRLSRAGLHVGGFQVTARTSAGNPAGTWKSLDDRSRVSGAFVQHTEHGTAAPSEGMARWTVEWTAPATAAGTVTFNAAANASNDDASALGDFIYTSERVSREP
jgi:hypothetical protein